MKYDKSAALWKEANNVLVGGVNSPVRAFSAVGGDPFFAVSGSGPTITDADGNDYIDYVLSWGPLILGHAHPKVTEAITKAVERGSSFGIPIEGEIRLAERIIQHVPSIEKVRLVNSGTEATMSAIRLARGVTGRDLVVKMEGCYHGHVDSLLVKAGSGLATFGVPTSPGVPKGFAESTLTVPYNDLEAVRQVFAERGNEVACVIVEPVPGNMGMVLPRDGYLEGLRAVTKEHGALLIFDEVMSGFRVAMGGAQGHYGVTPDLTALGKVIGGGMPVGAYGGPAGIMGHLSPEGPVYQAGTLAGNPLATAAGVATLDVLADEGQFEQAAQSMAKLGAGLVDAAKEAGIPVTLNHLGTMACLFFNENPVESFAGASNSDTGRFARYFRGMLERGIYVAPSQFEVAFMSTVHTASIIDQTLEAAREVFKAL